MSNYLDLGDGNEPPQTAETIPDEAILESSQDRPELFGMLVDRYEQPFRRLAMRVVRNMQEAEDVVQEAFVKIYRYAKRFKKGEDRKFSSWAYKIVLNTSITHYHKSRKREWNVPEETEASFAESHVQFREIVLERETEAVVKEVLKEMPQELALLLDAYYLKDQSYKAISAQNSISIGALKMKLFRARKLFRKILGKSQSV